MVLTSPPNLDQLHWFGFGPLDAHPNKRSAPLLGLWGGKAGNKDTSGTKVTRWIERSGATDGFRLTSKGYLQSTAAEPDRMRILSGIVGRPKKGRKAEEAVSQLETNKQPFTGDFTLLPK